MKRAFFVALALIFSTSVTAMDTPTAALGEKLFNDSSLGTTGNSCASCHPNGSKLEESKSYDDEMLSEMINFCIRDALKGEMLAPESTELNALRLFVRQLEK